MCVWNSRDEGKHHSLLSPGTGHFTCFHLQKKLNAPLKPEWRGGGEFQMTDALILLVTLLLF